MDVDEGFILGVYNYCDRWCEQCRFTSRCRLFADKAEHEARPNPELAALADAAPHPSDVREPPSWLTEMIEELERISREAVCEDACEVVPERKRIPVDHEQIVAEAGSYRDRVWRRLDASGTDERDADDPYSIILWFSSLIPAKVYRALHGLADFDGDREFPPDHEGSAKVALIGIDRSIEAWNDAVAVGRLSPSEANELTRLLEHLRSQIERAVPRARQFVRPGFDELDEVRALDATDWA